MAIPWGAILGVASSAANEKPSNLGYASAAKVGGRTQPMEINSLFEESQPSYYGRPTLSGALLGQESAMPRYGSASPYNTPYYNYLQNMQLNSYLKNFSGGRGSTMPQAQEPASSGGGGVKGK